MTADKNPSEFRDLRYAFPSEISLPYQIYLLYNSDVVRMNIRQFVECLSKHKLWAITQLFNGNMFNFVRNLWASLLLGW